MGDLDLEESQRKGQHHLFNQWEDARNVEKPRITKETISQKEMEEVKVLKKNNQLEKRQYKKKEVMCT